MSQIVTYIDFTKEELQTEAGVSKLNLFLRDLVAQIHALQGTTGAIKPDADIDLQGLYSVINPK